MTNEEKAREYQAFIESNNPSAEAYGFYNAYISACEWKDQEFITKAREWFQLSAWSFAHSVDGQPDYDAAAAFKSFLKSMGYDEDA